MYVLFIQTEYRLIDIYMCYINKIYDLYEKNIILKVREHGRIDQGGTLWSKIVF